MGGDGLNRKLADIHGSRTGAGVGPEHRIALETDLQNRYRRKYPRNRRWLMLLNPWNRISRIALASLAILVFGIGACSTSTVSEVKMGQKATILLDPAKGQEVPTVDRELKAFLESRTDIEDVNVSLQMEEGGATEMALMVWGQGLDSGQFVADLRREVPSLAEADISCEPLTGTMEESYASKWTREIFRMEVEGATADEIRAQIYAQLAEQGLDGDAEVDVQMQDGRTEIKVKVIQEDGE